MEKSHCSLLIFAFLWLWFIYAATKDKRQANKNNEIMRRTERIGKNKQNEGALVLSNSRKLLRMRDLWQQMRLRMPLQTCFNSFRSRSTIQLAHYLRLQVCPCLDGNYSSSPNRQADRQAATWRIKTAKKSWVGPNPRCCDLMTLHLWFNAYTGYLMCLFFHYWKVF